MSRLDSAGAFLRVLLVFFVYSVAVQGFDSIVPSLYRRAALALVLTLLVILILDGAPAAIRGQRPTFDEGSFFYSARGLLAIVTFILLAAVLADWLRGSFGLQEWLLMAIAALVAAVVVFGGLVVYYWRTGAPAKQVGT